MYISIKSVWKGTNSIKGEEKVHGEKDVSHNFADEILIRASD
jgi:hypothetical protein